MKNKLEELRDELQRVAAFASEFNVSHTKVAKANGIGYTYANEIRKGEKPSQNTKENHSLIQGLINSYRKEIRRKQKIMQPLNVTGKNFCKAIGIAYNNEILRQLRCLNLVGFFKVGNKYLYAKEDVQNVNEKLRNGEISIKTDKGSYYITLNKEIA